MAETLHGTVKFVHPTGFLFLVCDDHASSDIFGHCTDWEKAGLRAPEKGEKFQFEVVEAKRGPKAINPRPVQ